jgi:tetratricopeptide (TPR) repeat protein
LAAVVGHFVEINFGIAIVATRTLFWTYAGITLVVGYIIPKMNIVDTPVNPLTETRDLQNYSSDRKKSRQSAAKQKRKIDRNVRPIIGNRPNWVRNALIAAVILGIIIATLGFDYETNSSHSTSFIAIMINSVSRLANKENAVSLGILFLIINTWLVGLLLYITEEKEQQDYHIYLKSLGLIAIVSISIGFLFWVWNAISLAVLAGFTPADQNGVIVQVNSIGSLLTKYYLFLFFIILFVALVLPEDWPQRSIAFNSYNLGLVPITLILVLVIVNFSNLRVIHADITFKMADPFTKNSQWQVATFLYKRALELAPNEDHYYLFLGRSYLEQAKIITATADQDNLVLQAEKDLKVAQSINPLNTDHTANLARLYSWWAGKATTTSVRSDRAQKASDYYETAVTLSPNNSSLWDEWAVLFMEVLGQSQQALERLQHALALDASFSFTQGLFGNYYMRIAGSTDDITAKKQALETAAEYYRKAADVAKSTDTTSKASYLVSLGNVYVVMAGLEPQNANRVQLQQAVNILLESIDAGLSSSDLWKVQELVAKLYLQLGDKNNAQYYANQALISAPSSATSRIQDLITQTLTLP